MGYTSNFMWSLVFLLGSFVGLFFNRSFEISRYIQRRTQELKGLFVSITRLNEKHFGRVLRFLVFNLFLIVAIASLEGLSPKFQLIFSRYFFKLNFATQFLSIFLFLVAYVSMLFNHEISLVVLKQTFYKNDLKRRNIYLLLRLISFILGIMVLLFLVKLK